MSGFISLKMNFFFNVLKFIIHTVMLLGYRIKVVWHLSSLQASSTQTFFINAKQHHFFILFDAIFQWYNLAWLISVIIRNFCIFGIITWKQNNIPDVCHAAYDEQHQPFKTQSKAWMGNGAKFEVIQDTTTVFGIHIQFFHSLQQFCIVGLRSRTLLWFPQFFKIIHPLHNCFSIFILFHIECFYFFLG